MVLDPPKDDQLKLPRRNSNVDVQCPVEPGQYHIVQTVALPKEIPQGELLNLLYQSHYLIRPRSAKFVVNVRGYTAEDDDLVCLDLKVNFMKGFPLW